MAISIRRTGGAVAVSVCALLTLPFLLSPAPRDPVAGGKTPVAPVREGLTQDNRPGPDTYSADLPVLRQKGVLRILYLESRIEPEEKRMLEQFSRAHDLVPEWVPADTPWQLLTSLEDGRGDIIASLNESVHAGPALPVRNTLSWGMTQPRVVGRDGGGVIDEARDLSVRQIAVREQSPVSTLVASMQKDAPGMDVITIPVAVTDRQVLERVSSGRYDLAVMDSQSLQSLLADYPDLEIQLSLGEPEYRHWLVHENAGRLHGSLNRFINRKHLQMDLAKVYREDLASLKKRRLLRLITYRSPVNVFFENGRFRGFEYELIRRFAEENGLRVDVVIARDQSEMQSLLKQGRGDVIAASLPQSTVPEGEGLRASKAYNHSAPVLVGRSHDSALQAPRDLDGRRIYLPEESPWRGYLETLREEQGIDVEIIAAEDGLNTETVLFRVARGLYDLTVIGSHEVNAEFSRQLNLKAHFRLAEPRPQAWVVRASDMQLLTALNGFIGREYRRGFYNVLYSRYIERPGKRKASANQLAELVQLSPFDRIVHEYAKDYGFDWRLIVAQMYQESRFDPMAVSYAGAEGLMQLLPATAEEVGVEERDDPAHNILGGIRYLDYLRGRFDDIPQLQDRTWFTLAAYNAGYRRIQQARRLAEETGLNPNRWFDNVETAMLALAQPYRHDGEWTRRCRCGQTVVYVREIRTLYNNYVRVTESIRSAGTSRAINSPALN
ncbi:MAG: transglycosylase SLT domain-containing protein [Gammaproteobacteria bacterium]